MEPRRERGEQGSPGLRGERGVRGPTGQGFQKTEDGNYDEAYEQLRQYIQFEVEKLEKYLFGNAINRKPEIIS